MKIIDVKGNIVRNNDKWIYDWLEWDATCPKDVISQLRESKDDEIEVNINSGGGNVYAGIEIYTALKEHKGKVTCKIVGLAASAASIIAMAGQSVKISPVGQVMIHKASIVASGNHKQLDHVSDILQSHDEGIANAYMLKTGMDKKAILDLMDKETYFSAKKALELGFVDEIMFDDDMQLSANVKGDIPPEVINKIKNLLIKNDASSSASGEGAFFIPEIENGVDDPQPTSNIQPNTEPNTGIKEEQLDEQKSDLKAQQEGFRKLKFKIMGGMLK